MAKSPVHKLGQLIGNFIEKFFVNELIDICQRRELYLDVVGSKRQARKGKKVTWVDVFGSNHDLDFVIERNGSEHKLGIPVALIECAWRRYTKHSKNKAQEIQGAILPVAEKYKYHKPFLGAIIAGDFTYPSLDQLSGCGFSTVYFKSKDIFDSFQEVGINIYYDEDTSDFEANNKVNLFNSLNNNQLNNVFYKIIEKSENEITRFKDKLTQSLDRQISSIVIAPMFGSNNNFHTIDEAIEYLNNDELMNAQDNIELMNIFIQLIYSNGDKIEGTFKSVDTAKRFLFGNIINE